jgi:hypothetical protein
MEDKRLLQMQVFRAVVEHDGFTAAAYALESSQPFVSRTIAQLERRLGAKLIHRNTRRHRLTEEGERYLATCREILGALDDAENTFAGNSMPAGDLRVSAPLAFGTDQVLPLLPTFLAIHPSVKVHLSLSDAIVNLIDTMSTSPSEWGGYATLSSGHVNFATFSASSSRRRPTLNATAHRRRPRRSKSITASSGMARKSTSIAGHFVFEANATNTWRRAISAAATDSRSPRCAIGAWA